jgi:hypothetical protein
MDHWVRRGPSILVSSRRIENQIRSLLGRAGHKISSIGQLPDVLVKQIVNALPEKHPFDIRWNKTEKVPWESCARVLESERRTYLSNGRAILWSPGIEKPHKPGFSTFCASDETQRYRLGHGHSLTY